MPTAITKKEEIPARINKLMTDAGVTAYDFDEPPEPVAQSTIANWLRGSEPGAFKLATFAIKCGRTPNDILLEVPMPGMTEQLARVFKPHQIENLRAFHEDMAVLVQATPESGVDATLAAARAVRAVVEQLRSIEKKIIGIKETSGAGVRTLTPILGKRSPPDISGENAAVSEEAAAYAEDKRRTGKAKRKRGG